MVSGIDRLGARQHLADRKLFPIAAHGVQKYKAKLVLEALRILQFCRRDIEEIPGKIGTDFGLIGRLDLDNDDRIVVARDIIGIVEIDRGIEPDRIITAQRQGLPAMSKPDHQRFALRTRRNEIARIAPTQDIARATLRLEQVSRAVRLARLAWWHARLASRGSAIVVAGIHIIVDKH